MTERRVGAQQQRRLEREGFTLEVTRAGKRFWKEPGTERRLSGDHAVELVRQKEARILEAAGWERVEEAEGETYWCRPDSGRLYPQGAAYDVVQGA
jgi:ectoine hydroxylase-related dioxygenase (phytanoyl-CoA dioxygenase family)